jgi:exopolyphosphatase/guanosine-5'-triphosphate,3'-diphosphate pyrophosphatase
MFFPKFEISSASINMCEKWIEGELFPVIKILKELKIDMVIGSSGTIMSAGFMIKSSMESVYPLSILNNYIFSRKNLEKTKRNVLRYKTIEERKKIKGLDVKRADIIPAGIIILSSIFKQLEIDEMTISAFALREGIIFDAINKKADLKQPQFFGNIRLESANKLAESCNYDYKHCFHVSKLAEIIFDQLADLHLLSVEYKEYLIIASILHDIGFHIAHSKHHIHSQYIIVNSELLGFNENEIRSIACIARYHRKSHPKTSHREFMLLPEDWKTIVKKLSAILRIADAFDRTHNSLVKDIKVKVNKNSVVFNIPNKLEEIEIELWSIGRKKKLFENIYNKKVKVVSIE